MDFFRGLWRLHVGGVGGQLLLNFIDNKKEITYDIFSKKERNDFL